MVTGPTPGTLTDRSRNHVMSLRLLFASALIGTSSLLAVPALAFEPVPTYDDTSYPDQHASFAAASSNETPIVTPDMTYPGPHPVFAKEQGRSGSSGALAFDDTSYPTADLAKPARGGSAPPTPARPPQDQRVACGCPRS
jgi:hypothetical protein